MTSSEIDLTLNIILPGATLEKYSPGDGFTRYTIVTQDRRAIIGPFLGKKALVTALRAIEQYAYIKEHE